jgi:hypothetical protein
MTIYSAFVAADGLSSGKPSPAKPRLADHLISGVRAIDGLP